MSSACSRITEHKYYFLFSNLPLKRQDRWVCKLFFHCVQFHGSEEASLSDLQTLLWKLGLELKSLQGDLPGCCQGQTKCIGYTALYRICSTTSCKWGCGSADSRVGASSLSRRIWEVFLEGVVMPLM